LTGSSFTYCKFDYSIFERTLVDSDILDSKCELPENLKMKFARTLRVNFQQLGDASSVNKAITLELQATEIHLRNAWRSSESYYRDKYPGWRRFTAFVDWIKFRALDLVWGNGESAKKLIGTILAVLLVMGFVDVVAYKDPKLVSSYVTALIEMPQIFLGTFMPSYYPRGYLTFIQFIRLLAFGFFMAIIVKRFNRR